MSTLQTCLLYCSNKMAKNRTISLDHMYFTSHIYTAVFYRLPTSATSIINTISNCSERLQGTEERVPSKYTQDGEKMNSLKRGDNHAIPKVLVSPKTLRKNWLCFEGNDNLSCCLEPFIHCADIKLDGIPNESPENDLSNDHELPHTSSTSRILEKFYDYKIKRCTDDLISSNSNSESKDTRHVQLIQDSISATLELAFQLVSANIKIHHC